MGFYHDMQKLKNAVDEKGNFNPLKVLQDEEINKKINSYLSVDLRNKINEGLIPQYFYKYRSLSHTLDIIRTGTLKFSTVGEFKDPFDGVGDWVTDSNDDYQKMIIDGFASRLPQDMPSLYKEIFLLKLRKDPELYLKKCAVEAMKLLHENAGIFCMTPICDDIIMWAYYADSHRGTCLKLDISEDTDLFCGLQAVVYQKNMPRRNILGSEQSSQAFWEAITTKHSDWFYEQEARVIHHRQNGYLPFKKKVLKEILFGVYTTQAEINEVKTALCEHGFHDVLLKKARLNATRYKLEFHDIGRI